MKQARNQEPKATQTTCPAVAGTYRTLGLSAGCTEPPSRTSSGRTPVAHPVQRRGPRGRGLLESPPQEPQQPQDISRGLATDSETCDPCRQPVAHHRMPCAATLGLGEACPVQCQGTNKGPNFRKQRNKWEEGECAPGVRERRENKHFLKVKIFVSLEGEREETTGRHWPAQPPSCKNGECTWAWACACLHSRPPTDPGANKFLAEQVCVGGLIYFPTIKALPRTT